MRRVFFTFVLLLLAFQSALAWTHGSSSGGSAPSNTALPVVTSSSPVVGTAETATNGSWTGSPTSYTYQWEYYDTSTNISGATSSSYTPVTGDIGHTLAITVTASNSHGSTPATSAATSAVTSGGSFTPSFQTAKIAAGGLLNNIWVNSSDGSLMLSANTYGAYYYRSTGTCASTANGGWGTQYSAPCFEQLFTAQSVSGWTLANAGNLSQGVLEIDGCNNNTADAYAFFNGNLWVTTTLTGSASSRSWAKTPLTNSINGNEGVSAGSSHAIACDPANPNVVYAATPTGVNVSGNGLSGASATFATVSGVGTTGTIPSLISFSPTSSSGTCSAISGSPTCTLHAFVFAAGTGLYETVNGGTNWVETTGGPGAISGNLVHMITDKCGNVFVSVNSTHIYMYVPNGTAGGGSWTTLTPGLYSPVSDFGIDPTASTCATERMAASAGDGAISTSTNQGSSWVTVQISVSTGNTFAAPSPQPAWIGNANQYGSDGAYIYLDTQDIVFDNSGNLWAASGTGSYEMSVGNVLVNGVWNANLIGIEQLVGNALISAPGSAPVVDVWDRGFFSLQNPDVFPSDYWPDASYSLSYGSINAGWAVTYSSYNSGGSACGSSCNFFTGWVSYDNNLGASSSDGGYLWTVWPSQPASGGEGGAIAAASPTDWIVNPGQSYGLYYTLNAGSTWVPLTIAGASTPWSGLGGRLPIAADTVAATTYCIVDASLNFYSSTASTPVFTKVASAGATDGGAYNDKLKAVPGIAGDFFYSGGNDGGGTTSWHLWKSTNTCASWTDVDTGLTNIYGYGFGAPKPGGSGVPVIYAYGTISGVAGIYENDDLATSTTWTLIPNSTLAGNSLDYVKDVSGDMNTYGRVYITFNGSGYDYVDTASACPWVAFSNTLPGASLTGTVSLQAQTSGLAAATISDVKFYVDGTLIGSQTSYTGGGTPQVPRTYTQSWVTGGVATGAHTLTVASDGNGCTANAPSDGFSIPITTH